jgi:soluble lytic murein transglycosylase
MKRAFPDWGSERGDMLPDPVWRILYPMRYEDQLLESAHRQGLDPALVAGVIWQESTFDASAESPAGALGLMQVMPRTGRSLARSLGLRYRRSMLTDPEVGLKMGTLYLRRMIDAHGGHIERALAAYNAGPGRVRSWTAARPGLTAEDFIETIPFTETRNYVMGILAHQEHYRRLYGMPPSPERAAGAADLP